MLYLFRRLNLAIVIRQILVIRLHRSRVLITRSFVHIESFNAAVTLRKHALTLHFKNYPLVLFLKSLQCLVLLLNLSNMIFSRLRLLMTNCWLWVSSVNSSPMGKWIYWWQIRTCIWRKIGLRKLLALALSVLSVISLLHVLLVRSVLKANSRW